MYKQDEPITYVAQTTTGLWVLITPSLNAENSSHEQKVFTWECKMRIENRSDTTVKITNVELDIYGKYGINEHIKDKNTTERSPVINPGEYFEYATELVTYINSGILCGKYTILDIDSAELYTVDLPACSLDGAVNSEEIN